MSNIYTIEITKKLVDEFYGQFFDHVNESIRDYWMDHTGERGRTLEEACMAVVCASEGYSLQQMFDDEAELDGDQYQMMIMDMVNEVATRMLRKMADEW